MFFKKALSRLQPVARNPYSFSTIAKQQLPPAVTIDEEYKNLLNAILDDALKPRETVEKLDSFIIGQPDAKRAVAIALRNRWRRQKLDADLRHEVIPKNILMIGPTGCGKTEIARRIAKLSQAPFIKVEATKYTEVGYQGKDVDTIIKDLLDVSIEMTRKRIHDEKTQEVRAKVERRVLQLIAGKNCNDKDYELYKKKLQSGAMDNVVVNVSNFNVDAYGNERSVGNIDVDVDRESSLPSESSNTNMMNASLTTAAPSSNNISSSDPSSKPDQFNNVDAATHGSLQSQTNVRNDAPTAVFTQSPIEMISNRLENVSSATKTGGNSTKMKISDIVKIFEKEEIEKSMKLVDVFKEAITCAEQTGIVFIDEIDKLINTSDGRGGEASSVGVQKDLLPLIEGCSIETKYGNVKTDYILFICSGAFHQSKPSELLGELQGRLPIRVTLQGLTENDYYRILTEPANNLLQQQIKMLETENILLKFTESAIKEIARIADEANRTVQNIGARRLHTVIERIVEEISFDAPDIAAKHRSKSAAGAASTFADFAIDDKYVRSRITDVVNIADLRKYIL